MVESVDTRDLKSLGHRLYEFKSRSGYHWDKANKINDKQCRVNRPQGGFFMPEILLSEDAFEDDFLTNA